MTKEELLQHLKSIMRTHKNEWYMDIIDVTMPDSEVLLKMEIKMFNKYIQVLRINGLTCPTTEYSTQKELLNTVEKYVEQALREELIKEGEKRQAKLAFYND